jgi:hypothetical protein
MGLNLSEPPPVDLASCQDQVGMAMKIIIDPMLGHKTLFVYSYDF